MDVTVYYDDGGAPEEYWNADVVEQDDFIHIVKTAEKVRTMIRKDSIRKIVLQEARSERK